jgi:tetratricopeptide (TPR) repeat protein
MKFLKQYALALIAAFLLFGCNAKEKNNDQIREVTADHRERVGSRLSSLNEAIRKDPSNPEIYFRRAKVNLTAGNPDKAADDAGKAIGLDSLQGKYYLILAKAYKAMGQANAGIIPAVRAEQLNYQSPDLYVTLGEMYIQTKEYNKALEYLDKALKLYPYEENAYYLKGVVYSETGDTTNAIYSYRTSVEQNPVFTEGYNALAEIYIGKKLYDIAMQYVNAGIRFTPEDGELIFNRGLIFFHTQQPDSARNLFKKAIFYEPEMYIANYYLGMISYQAKNYAEAIPFLEVVVNQKNTMDAAHYYLAICNLMLGKRDRSIMHYKRAVAIGGSYAKDAAAALYRIRAQSAPKAANNSNINTEKF